MKILQLRGPFNEGTSLLTEGQAEVVNNSTYVKVGVQVPYRTPARYIENDIEILDEIPNNWNNYEEGDKIIVDKDGTYSCYEVYSAYETKRSNENLYATIAEKDGDTEANESNNNRIYYELDENKKNPVYSYVAASDDNTGTETTYTISDDNYYEVEGYPYYYNNKDSNDKFIYSNKSNYIYDIDTGNTSSDNSTTKYTLTSQKPKGSITYTKEQSYYTANCWDGNDIQIVSNSEYIEGYSQTDTIKTAVLQEYTAEQSTKGYDCPSVSISEDKTDYSEVEDFYQEYFISPSSDTELNLIKDGDSYYALEEKQRQATEIKNPIKKDLLVEIQSTIAENDIYKNLPTTVTYYNVEETDGRTYPNVSLSGNINKENGTMALNINTLSSENFKANDEIFYKSIGDLPNTGSNEQYKLASTLTANEASSIPYVTKLYTVDKDKIIIGDDIGLASITKDTRGPYYIIPTNGYTVGSTVKDYLNNDVYAQGLLNWMNENEDDVLLSAPVVVVDKKYDSDLLGVAKLVPAYDHSFTHLSLLNGYYVWYDCSNYCSEYDAWMGGYIVGNIVEETENQSYIAGDNSTIEVSGDEIFYNMKNSDRKVLQNFLEQHPYEKIRVILDPIGDGKNILTNERKQQVCYNDISCELVPDSNYTSGFYIKDKHTEKYYTTVEGQDKNSTDTYTHVYTELIPVNGFDTNLFPYVKTNLNYGNLVKDDPYSSQRLSTGYNPNVCFNAKIENTIDSFLSLLYHGADNKGRFSGKDDYGYYIDESNSFQYSGMGDGTGNDEISCRSTQYKRWSITPEDSESVAVVYIFRPNYFNGLYAKQSEYSKFTNDQKDKYDEGTDFYYDCRNCFDTHRFKTYMMDKLGKEDYYLYGQRNYICIMRPVWNNGTCSLYIDSETKQVAGKLYAVGGSAHLKNTCHSESDGEDHSYNYYKQCWYDNQNEEKFKEYVDEISSSSKGAIEDITAYVGKNDKIYYTTKPEDQEYDEITYRIYHDCYWYWSGSLKGLAYSSNNTKDSNGNITSTTIWNCADETLNNTMYLREVDCLDTYEIDSQNSQKVECLFEVNINEPEVMMDNILTPITDISVIKSLYEINSNNEYIDKNERVIYSVATYENAENFIEEIVNKTKEKPNYLYIEEADTFYTISIKQKYVFKPYESSGALNRHPHSTFSSEEKDYHLWYIYDPDDPLLQSSLSLYIDTDDADKYENCTLVAKCGLNTNYSSGTTIIPSSSVEDMYSRMLAAYSLQKGNKVSDYVVGDTDANNNAPAANFWMMKKKSSTDSSTDSYLDVYTGEEETNFSLIGKDDWVLLPTDTTNKYQVYYKVPDSTEGYSYTEVDSLEDAYYHSPIGYETYDDMIADKEWHISLYNNSLSGDTYNDAKYTQFFYVYNDENVLRNTIYKLENQVYKLIPGSEIQTLAEIGITVPAQYVQFASTKDSLPISSLDGNNYYVWLENDSGSLTEHYSYTNSISSDSIVPTTVADIPVTILLNTLEIPNNELSNDNKWQVFVRRNKNSETDEIENENILTRLFQISDISDYYVKGNEVTPESAVEFYVQVEDPDGLYLIYNPKDTPTNSYIKYNDKIYYLSSDNANSKYYWIFKSGTKTTWTADKKTVVEDIKNFLLTCEEITHIEMKNKKLSITSTVQKDRWKSSGAKFNDSDTSSSTGEKKEDDKSYTVKYTKSTDDEDTIQTIVKNQWETNSSVYNFEEITDNTLVGSSNGNAVVSSTGKVLFGDIAVIDGDVGSGIVYFFKGNDNIYYGVDTVEKTNSARLLPIYSKPEDYNPEYVGDILIKELKSKDTSTDNYIRISERNILEFDNLSDCNLEFIALRDLPRETIIDIGYEEPEVSSVTVINTNTSGGTTESGNTEGTSTTINEDSIYSDLGITKVNGQSPIKHWYF